MIIIGEKINASRKSIAKAILSQDADVIQNQIKKQDCAGADYIDLNAGTGVGDADKEFDDMRWLIDLALESTDKPLGIDSADPRIIRQAAEYLEGKRTWLLNSVKNDKDVLDTLMPVAAEHGCAVIALSMSGKAIPEDVPTRIDNCQAIFESAKEAGVQEQNLFFDPLVMPISSNTIFGRLAMDTLQGLKETFPQSKTTMGISNCSFGLPHRFQINGAFLLAAIVCGLDSAICDPTNSETKHAIILGELVIGRDRHCRQYTRAARKGEFKKKAALK